MPARFVAVLCVLTLVGFLSPLAVADDAAPGFAGRWETTYGEMNLSVTDDQVSGAYVMGGARCPIEGKLVNGRFEFTYQEPGVAGEGWFELGTDGNSFSGEWRENGVVQWSTWTGTRLAARPATTPALEPIADVPGVGFAGLWETPHGRLRLIERGGYLHGVFADSRDLHDYFSIPGASTREVEYSPQEGIAGYHLKLELSEDGNALTGERWYRDNNRDTWTASRVEAQPDKTWLIVLEARWESGLEEGEYTFGEMLNAFFDRTPHVLVRHRIFNDAVDFDRYGSEVAFLAEPVVVCVATHASSEGVTVCDELLGPDLMADVFRFGDSIQLVHYSACQIMAGTISQTMHETLQTFARFPISGYGSTVDWAGSAVIEFMYFDLIFNRGMSPEAAQAAVVDMMPFAGTGHPSPAGEADFRIALPPAASEVESQFADGDPLALSFDGRDDYIEIPGLVLGNDSHVTIEAWIEIDPGANPRSTGVPIHLTGPVDLSLWASSSLDWSARVGANATGGADTILLRSARLGDRRGVLTHVALVWNGNQPTLFVDGQPVGDVEERPGEWIHGSDARLLIGAALRPGDENPSAGFRGIIDELRVSSIARYLDESGEPMAFEPPRTFECDEQTLALFHFDEASPTEVADASPNGLNGVIHGAARVPSVLAP
jgi:hypothetical protein